MQKAWAWSTAQTENNPTTHGLGNQCLTETSKSSTAYSTKHTTPEEVRVTPQSKCQWEREAWEHCPDEQPRLQWGTGLSQREQRAHLESAPAAQHTQPQPVAARFLDWWHESSHLFYLKEKQKKEVSVIRSIAPEWKTGFLKQIQDNKEFHKINLTNSFFCRLSNFKKMYQAIFIFEPEWNTVVFKMKGQGR